MEISFTLDYTHGYGYIIEAEIIVSNENDIKEAEIKIEDALRQIGIEISPKTEFKEKYNDYVINWQEYTKEIIEESFFD
jgi:adenylate cyclase class IV